MSAAARVIDRDARIVGRGLHGGAPSSVRFARCDGPAILRSAGCEVAIADLRVLATERSTTLGAGGVRVATVEHLFAALAALGARSGFAIDVDGPEIPLAGGGAAELFDAIASLALPAEPPSIVVARAGEIAVGDARYRFEEGDGVDVEVEVDFDDARLAKHARWRGDAADFRVRIATARTFGFAREVDALLARGLASHVTPESVVVVCEDRVLSAGAPFAADEPARHKLLDLVGDMYAHGGPPRGRVRATRPGHAATNEAMLAALSMGLVVTARR
ncbi:MAG TPA: UDP-3-O-acyl-N-acetylglucosamine deacetylase [Labilithrix sp.]